MAQLDIQPKRGTSAIWWIIGLILLVAIIWWIVAANDNDNVVAEAPGAVAIEPATTTVSPIGDIAIITTAPDAADLVGRPVVVNDAEVRQVVSDKGFWIGPSDTQRVFVVLNEVPTPGTPTEGRYDVNTGNHVTVFGTVQPMPTVLSQSASTWNLNSTDSSALAAQAVYVRADSLRML